MDAHRILTILAESGATVVTLFETDYKTLMTDPKVREWSWAESVPAPKERHPKTNVLHFTQEVHTTMGKVELRVVSPLPFDPNNTMRDYANRATINDRS